MNRRVVESVQTARKKTREISGFGRQAARTFVHPAIIVGAIFALSTGCSENGKEAVSADDGWANYTVEPPSSAVIEDLQQRAAIYPSTECAPYDESTMSVAERYLDTSEDDSTQLCVWHHPAGCVPEGQNYADIGSCDEVRTLGPSWFLPPVQRFASDPQLLTDESYVTELEWVTSQVAASGCSCCHASEKSGYASFFDIDAPGSWTDTLTMTGIVLAAGMADEHKYLGYLPPEDNFGFDRETTVFATTDIPRMKAFFQAEFERRGGTAQDVEVARDTFKQINGSLFETPSDCGPGEGMDANGKLVWKGGGARQVYIQEVGSENPGSPPNLDKPAGTVWALYADPEDAPFGSGTIEPGLVPDNGRQAVPATPESSPVFENGRQYRLFVTPDFIRSNQSNCIFTFGEAAADPDSQVCGSDNTVCAQLLIPETLESTPEKLLVALYRNLPPLGPPDVFPPFSVDEPSLTPRTTIEVKLDAAVTGTYQILAVLYMPGGGLVSWQPLAGVDYTAASEPFELDGSGLVIPTPLIFDIAE